MDVQEDGTTVSHLILFVLDKDSISAPMRSVRLLLTLLLLVPHFAVAGAYHGQVVDAATGEPLSDAVVVVWWYRRAIISMDGPFYFHDAKEAVTDDDGRFSLSCWRKPDLNPFTYVQAPSLGVFKPGYEPLAPGFSRNKGLARYDDWRSELRKGAVIKLPKLRPEQEDWRRPHPERGLVTDPGVLGMIGDIPESKLPNLFRLINVERRQHGLGGHIGTPSGGSDR